MDTNGYCVESNEVLNTVAILKSIFNYIERRGIKSLCLALDDLWLYNYHKNNYDGTALTIFETIKYIEEKQWQLVGLDQERETVEHSIQQT